jgi:hypothetical protein
VTYCRKADHFDGENSPPLVEGVEEAFQVQVSKFECDDLVCSLFGLTSGSRASATISKRVGERIRNRALP